MGGFWHRPIAGLCLAKSKIANKEFLQAQQWAKRILNRNGAPETDPFCTVETDDRHHLWAVLTNRYKSYGGIDDDSLDGGPRQMTQFWVAGR